MSNSSKDKNYTYKRDWCELTDFKLQYDKWDRESVRQKKRPLLILKKLIRQNTFLTTFYYSDARERELCIFVFYVSV